MYVCEFVQLTESIKGMNHSRSRVTKWEHHVTFPSDLEARPI